MIADLTIGFVLFTALSFLDELSASGSFSGTKVIGIVVAGSWVGADRDRASRQPALVHRRQLARLSVAMVGAARLVGDQLRLGPSFQARRSAEPAATRSRCCCSRWVTRRCASAGTWCG